MANEGSPANRLRGPAAILAALTSLGTAGAAFPDNIFAIVGSSDATKKAQFEVDGFTTATTRTFTLPNADTTLAGLSVAQTFTAAQTISNATASTTTGTGALIVAGGVGVAGSINLGGEITATGKNRAAYYVASVGQNSMPSGDDSAAMILMTGASGSAPFNSEGSLVYRSRVSAVAGRSSHYWYTGSPAALRMTLNESGVLSLAATTASTSATTGAAIVGGGLGVGLTIHAGDDTNGTHVLGRGQLGSFVSSDTFALSHYDHATVTNYALLQLATGATILNTASGTNFEVRINNASAMFINATTLSVVSTIAINVNSATASTSTTTGAMIVSGGIGIAGAINVGGNAVLTGSLLMNAAAAQNVAVSGTTIAPVIQAHGTGGNASSATLARYSGAATAGFFVMAKSRGTSVGSLTVVQDADHLGTIAWNGSDGTAFREAALIRCEVDGTPGASDMPGRILFLTTPDGTASPVEAMRINAAGTVVVTASTTARATLRIPHGTAPTSPVDGDFWTTTAGAFIRINGVTKTFTLT